MGLGLGLDGTLDRQTRCQDEYDLLAAYNASHLTPSDNFVGIKESRVVPSCALTSSLIHDVATLTPPADKGDIEWNPIARISHAPEDSRPTDTTNTVQLPAEDVPAPSGESSSRLPDQNTNVDVVRSCIDGALDVLRK